MEAQLIATASRPEPEEDQSEVIVPEADTQVDEVREDMRLCLAGGFKLDGNQNLEN